MAGRATRIDVTLLADGGVPGEPTTGPGIPVGPHPKYPKQSTAEIVLTTLHAGGKFGGKGYQVSGGLHGVGRLGGQRPLDPAHPRGGPRRPALGGRVREGRQGQAARSRRPARRRRTAAPASRGRAPPSPSGPTPRVFDETEFRAQTIVERMQIMAFLNKGLEIRFVDERTDPVTKTTYKYNGGIVDFVKHLNASKESLFRKVASFEQAEEGQEVEIALQWNAGYHESIHSFANGISTIEGGMHVEGFSKSLTNVVNRYARARNLLKEKEENLKGEDIREGLTAIISVRLRDPQFEGQTKAKLGQHVHPLADRAHDEPEADRVARGEPARGESDRAEVDAGGAGPPGRPGRPRPDAAQVGARRRRACPASWPTARRATRASPSSSSWRATRPAARPRTPATRTRRPSCPSGARSSTSSGPGSTRC